MTPALRALISLLADDLVEGYLRPKPANDAGQESEAPNPVPLPDLDRAA